MMNQKVCAAIGMAVAMVSCAAPKATIVAEAPVKTEKPPEPAEAPAETTLPVDDGLRMPDMLAMPDEGDFRSTNSAARTGNPSNAVIARPPVDPPARTKPKAD